MDSANLTASKPAFCKGSGILPPRTRVLCIASCRFRDGWLHEALATAGATDVVVAETRDAASGLRRLRDELFDVVLLSHDPPALDALEILAAIRTGSREDQPLIVMGQQSEQQLAEFCFTAGADAYICVASATPQTLMWHVARAVESHLLRLENRRLKLDLQQRLVREQEEARRLVAQQRTLLSRRLESLDTMTTTAAGESGDAPPVESLPNELVQHYRELLQASVVMGQGNLQREMESLFDLMANADVTLDEAAMLHVDVLEEILEGLGNRGARHVMNRAQLLMLDVLMRLAQPLPRHLPQTAGA